MSEQATSAKPIPPYQNALRLDPQFAEARAHIQPLKQPSDSFGPLRQGAKLSVTNGSTEATP